MILERVWLDEESLSNTVDVYVGLLRRKIDAGQEVKLIQTVHGVGYVLRGPQALDSAKADSVKADSAKAEKP